ncbi:MAG: DinB family protein [Pirellulales bacterium]
MTLVLDHFKLAIVRQFEAALCMLNACIDRCSDDAWNAPVGNYAFCQVAFHVLFFTDFYLGLDEGSFRGQPFHREHEGDFRDYEELVDRPPVLLYERGFIKAYLQHCRSKCAEMIAAETEETVAAPARFPRRNISRMELYVYNLRHLQHHVAQLSLRRRIDAGEDIPWVASGWRDVLDH